MWAAEPLTAYRSICAFGATPESQALAVTGSAACRNCAGPQRNGCLLGDARVILYMAQSQNVTGRGIK